MKESNTLAENMNIKQLQREVWQNVKGEYMKDSNTIAVIVTTKQLQKEVWLNTKG